MSSAKRQRAPLSSRRRLPWILVALAALAGSLGVGGLFAWQWIKPRLLASPEYRVTAQQIEITPLPEWIHSDVREEVFRDPSLSGPLSIMDDDLVERIAKAFAWHPWVARVVAVTKRHPASVKVELSYRQPVCMVEVPDGLLPVDALATLLPTGDNFTSPEAAHYPRLEGVHHMPALPAGCRWADARVIGGAEIAAAIGPAWQTLGLRSIAPIVADPPIAADRANPAAANPNENAANRRVGEPLFALLTRGKPPRGSRRFLWGYAPGAGAAGELSAQEKVARLLRYLADHDTLDDPQDARQEIDIRRLPAQ